MTAHIYAHKSNYTILGSDNRATQDPNLNVIRNKTYLLCKRRYGVGVIGDASLIQAVIGGIDVIYSQKLRDGSEKSPIDIWGFSNLISKELKSVSKQIHSKTKGVPAHHVEDMMNTFNNLVVVDFEEDKANFIHLGNWVRNFQHLEIQPLKSDRIYRISDSVNESPAPPNIDNPRNFLQQQIDIARNEFATLLGDSGSFLYKDENSVIHEHSTYISVHEYTDSIFQFNKIRA